MCDRCEELEEKVRQLTELLGVTEEPPKYGLTAKEWALYQLVAKRGSAHRDYLESALSLARDYAMCASALSVHVCRINAKLAPYGQRLTAIYGWGYKLEKISNGHHGRRTPVAASRGDCPALLA